MRISARAKFLKTFRTMACAIVCAAFLAFASPASAQTKTSETTHRHHETKHKAAAKTTHKTAHKATHKTTASHKKSASSKHKRSTRSTRHATTHHTARQRRIAAARRRRLARARHRYHHRKLTRHELARSRKLHKAFVASSQLRPMAQQLATLRSPAAYAGVTTYAHDHSGEAGSAAWLALGHAYLLDHKYPQAV